MEERLSKVAKLQKVIDQELLVLLKTITTKAYDEEMGTYDYDQIAQSVLDKIEELSK